MTEDRAEGKGEELKGRAQEALGDLTGDQDQQNQGEATQAHGKVDQVKGDVKQTIDDVTGG